ncbi:MAG TPA: hypothetical protein VK915_02750 [Gaiellaceae bacterium]|nr:hypothetical protein [Gaiellaceae bacterium]
MSAQLFLAATGSGLARAARSGDAWVVEDLLAGRDVRCLAADPLGAGTVYAGTQGEGVLRSDDGGRSWRQAGLEGHVIKSVAASPLVPGTAYAGTKPALVFRSRDGGETWRELEGFRRIRSRRLWFSPAEKPGTAYVQALALSPADPDVLLAGIEFGAVVRSADGGETWSGHRRGARRDCHSLAFHAVDGGWAYEGAGNGGGAFSRDGGRSWRHPKEGLDRRYGWAAAADPARPEVRYLSAAPGPGKAHGSKPAEACIFRAIGDGPWERLAGGLPQPLDYMPYALLTERESPGEVYAGLANGEVWHSADLGETWTKLPLDLTALRALLLLRGPVSSARSP